MEVAAAHLDDRAEAAVVGAAARGLDDVDRAAEEGVAGRARARARSGSANRAVVEPADRPRRRCVNGSGRRRGYDRPGNARRPAAPPFESAAAASRNVSSPSPRTMKSTPDRRRLVGLGRQARIVAAGDDGHRRLDRANQPDELQRGLAAGTSSPTGRRRPDRASRISRSTVGTHAILDEDRDRRRRRVVPGRRCRRATPALRSASASSAQACARTSRASRGAGPHRSLAQLR